MASSSTDLKMYPGKICLNRPKWSDMGMRWYSQTPLIKDISRKDPHKQIPQSVRDQSDVKINLSSLLF